MCARCGPRDVALRAGPRSARLIGPPAPIIQLSNAPRDRSLLLVFGRPLPPEADGVVDAHDEEERDSKEQCEQDY